MQANSKKNETMKQSFFFLFMLLWSSCLTQKVDKPNELSLANRLMTEQTIVFENKTFEEAVDFTTLLTQTQVGGKQFGITIQPSLTFINCVFQKEVNANLKDSNRLLTATFQGNVSFQDCTFKADVNFRGSLFYGKSIFTNSTFKGSTNFEETTFYQTAYFNTCKFEEEVRFQNSFFIQKANFMNTEFFEGLSFQSTVFNAEAQFSVGKFHKYTDFSLTDFRAKAIFNYSEFSERAKFSNVRFHGDVDFLTTIHHKTSFKKSRFIGNLRMFKSTLVEEMNFEESFFLFGQPDLDFLPDGKLKFS